jgi:squalene-hopene/tetraprenyl-beta-curcumene cyclase
MSSMSQDAIRNDGVLPLVVECAESGILSKTLASSIEWLLREQAPEGFWVGMVETNSSIEAEWLLAAHILETELPLTRGLIKTLIDRQRPDGSWDIYPGAPQGDINSTVEVYAALRATGHDQGAPVMRRAREWILCHGGLHDIRVFTRYWLAMIGVWPWRYTANLPPEIIRLPPWFPFNRCDTTVDRCVARSRRQSNGA